MRRIDATETAKTVEIDAKVLAGLVMTHRVVPVREKVQGRHELKLGRPSSFKGSFVESTREIDRSGRVNGWMVHAP